MQKMQRNGLKSVRLQPHDLLGMQLRVVLALWRILLSDSLQPSKSVWLPRSARQAKIRLGQVQNNMLEDSAFHWNHYCDSDSASFSNASGRPCSDCSVLLAQLPPIHAASPNPHHNYFQRLRSDRKPFCVDRPLGYVYPQRSHSLLRVL